MEPKAASDSKNKGKRVLDESQSETKDMVKIHESDSSFHIEVEMKSLKKFIPLDKMSCQVLLDSNFENFFNNHFASKCKWKRWCCCYCMEDFADSDVLLKHISDQHQESSFGKSDNFFTEFGKEFPPEWSKKIYDGCWEPLDVPKTCELFTNCIIHEWDQVGSSAMSEDSVRCTLLAEIGTRFKTLLWLNRLHITHLETLLNYAMRFLPESYAERLMRIGVDKDSIRCFRCLDGVHLESVRSFLVELSDHFKNPEDSTSLGNDDKLLDSPYTDLKADVDDGKLILVVKASQQNFEKRWKYTDNGVTYNWNTAVMSCWLYDDPVTVEKAFETWNEKKIARKERCIELIEMFVKECKKLRSLEVINKNLFDFREAFRNMKEINDSLEEIDRRIQKLEENLEVHKQGLSADKRKIMTRFSARSIKIANGEENISRNVHINASERQKSAFVARDLKERLKTVSVLNFLDLVMPIVKRFLQKTWESDTSDENIMNVTWDFDKPSKRQK